MSDRLPALNQTPGPSLPDNAALPAVRTPQPPLHERMLAYGAITVLVVEDMDISGHGPERYRVTIGGQPVPVRAAKYEPATARRTLETDLGTVVVPGAQERARGAQVTIGGMVVPGA